MSSNKQGRTRAYRDDGVIVESQAHNTQISCAIVTSTLVYYILSEIWIYRVTLWIARVNGGSTGHCLVSSL
jgi:hypothetical protein